MFDELSAPAVDAVHGFDVTVQVTASPQVFPDHAEFVTVRLMIGKRMLAEDLRVPKGQTDAAARRLAARVEPMLQREREVASRARGYA